MAVSLLLLLSRRLQAPCAALLLLGGLQLAYAVSHPAPAAALFGVRGVLASAVQIAPERS